MSSRSNISVIANPLADRELTKKLLKLTKRAAKDKLIKRGVKEVVKSIRKGQTEGLCILAGDISPVDVITHLPVLCEDAGIPYVFVPSKEKLGSASKTKRPTSCVLVSSKQASKWHETYEECVAGIKTLEPHLLRE